MIAALVVGGLGWITGSMTGPSEAAPSSGLAPDVQPVPAMLSGDAPVGHRVVTLEVSGMHCGSCAHKVYAALCDLPDVADAAVDVDAGRAQAVVPTGMAAEQVTASVTLPGLELLPLE